MNFLFIAGVRDAISRYPVLVFVHGESYEWSSGNPYDGAVLASHAGLVVVTINYRLGILGKFFVYFIISLLYSSLLRHRPSLCNTNENHNPSCKPSAYWWLLTIAKYSRIQLLNLPSESQRTYHSRLIP
jgi:hypothetical protein